MQNEEQDCNTDGTEEQDNHQLFDQFYAYLSTKDIKNARKMLREYNIFNNLSSRELNKQYNLDNYKFTKRNGELTLYKPIDKHLEQLQQDIHKIELEEQIRQNTNKIEETKKIFGKIDELEYKLNVLDSKVDKLQKDLIKFDRLVDERFNKLENRFTPTRTRYY